jgi:hypothetical protein
MSAPPATKKALRRQRKTRKNHRFADVAATPTANLEPDAFRKNPGPQSAPGASNVTLE